MPKRIQKIIVIVGPTASGKSDLAVQLAKICNGEVISADSRQVYKGMDIGTGKVTQKEMGGIPHHLLDVCSPKHVFSAHDFVVRGQKAIADISARGKVPIVVGGTGFYIDALLGRITLGNAPADPELRAELEEKSPVELVAMLKIHDLRRLKSILERNEQNNKVRLVRALELALTEPTNESKPSKRSQEGVLTTPLEYDVLWIGIKPDDQTLHERIHIRLFARMKRGMLAEVKRLHAQGVTWKRMESLGLEYRYLSRFLHGELSKGEMLEQLGNKIWQYARRQRTYWRRNKDIYWFNSKESAEILPLVKNFIS